MLELDVGCRFHFYSDKNQPFFFFSSSLAHFIAVLLTMNRNPN